MREGREEEYIRTEARKIVKRWTGVVKKGEREHAMNGVHED